LINVDVKSRPDITTVPRIMAVIQQVESELRDEGRVLVRYSGTQNMCRVMVEGPSPEVTDKYCRLIAAVVQETLN
jgi:phosphoglucosamine mutase